MKYIFIFLFSAVVVYGASDKEQDRATNRLFNSLKTSAMNGQEQSEVPDVIRSIGDLDAQFTVLQFAQEWITPCSSLHQVKAFVEVVAVLTPDERQKVGRLTNSLIKKSDPRGASLRAVHAPGYNYYEIGDNRSQVFCAIATLSAGEQESIVGFLKKNRFIIEGMEESNLVRLIKAIAAKPAEQRGSINTLVGILMESGIKGGGYLSSALNDCLPEERGATFEKIRYAAEIHRQTYHREEFPHDWKSIVKAQ